jgi:SAM-dependent methyltransferase
MDEYLEANRARWDELTPIHARSPFYDLDGFRAGKSSLHSIELEELGDVRGKSLLHLQCHFGQDTLSWARLGAQVTGVDFSEKAIALARSLADDLGIEARFICTTIAQLPAVLADSFDIVFTSYGVLSWQPDLRPWAETVARFVKPGGIFYIVEFHPFADIFDDAPGATEPRVAYPYFHLPEPLKWISKGTYADRTAAVTNVASHLWLHALSDVLNAIIHAGLRIEFVHEFPFSIVGTLPFVEQGADAYWRLKTKDGSIPLMFSVKAMRPGDDP